ncbi:anthranilate synthase component I family protein [Microbacterium sp. YY-01]|uniref:anthranilate synthase component I family protein n=1 Tax=Microbacterium sp. YY-01 TaxID=3421634 RepID=UPI003D16851E
MASPVRLHARLVSSEIHLETVFWYVNDRHADVFWLDSGPHAHEGWSLVGWGKQEKHPERILAVPAAEQNTPDAALPPFTGGWVGWWSYETGRELRNNREGVNTRSTDGSAWLAVRQAVAINHATGAVWALAGIDDIEAWADEVEATIALGSRATPDLDRDALIAAEARHSAAEYTALVRACMAAIARADVAQLCPTTTFTVPGQHCSAEIYGRLRSAMSAPHGGYVRVDATGLASASPEQFLRISGTTVHSSPIKGTRPRDADPHRDQALADELRNSRKEREENELITAGLQQQLASVCVPASVHRGQQQQIHSYATVHQLVSTVQGTLRADVSVRELLAAVFPAASMTGAPQSAAMSLLHEAEAGPRGVYSGCFGYIGARGGMNLGMVIRSVVVTATEATVGAGGGITALSDPDAETAEVALKAQGPLAAVGARVPWDLG